jgi:hypothetical protein
VDNAGLPILIQSLLNIVAAKALGRKRRGGVLTVRGFKGFARKRRKIDEFSR